MAKQDYPIKASGTRMCLHGKQSKAKPLTVVQNTAFAT